MSEIKTNIVSEEKLKKEYNVIIPVKLIKEEIENKLIKLQKTYKMDGFRVGKIPVETIRAREESRLFMQIGEEQVNKYVYGEVEKNNLNISGQPIVDIKKFELNESIEFNVVFNLMPEIPTINFSDIKLDKYIIEPQEDDIKESIDKLMASHKKFVKTPENTIAKLNDTVEINYIGKIDGEVFPGGAADGYHLKLGSKSFIDTFEEQLVGKKAGDKVEVKVNFPKEYHSAKLAGKPAIFDVEVIAIVNEEQQELTDDFVSTTFGIENIEKFRNLLKEELSKNFETHSIENLKQKLFKYLTNTIEIDIPDNLFKNQYESLWKQKEEELFKNPKLLEEKSKEEYQELTKESAKNSIKLGLILSNVAEKENITITEDEVMQALTKQALSMPGYEEMFLNFYKKNKEMLNSFRGATLETKIINSILEKIQTNNITTTIKEFEKVNSKE